MGTTEDVTTKIGNLLLKGWTMLGESCGRCLVTPLMRSRDKRLYCAKCDAYPAEQTPQREPEEGNLDTDFKLYSKLKEIKEIPMSDDSIHKPDWAPESYLKGRNDEDTLNNLEKILNVKLQKYNKILENLESSSTSLDKESQILSLIAQVLSILSKLKNMR